MGSGVSGGMRKSQRHDLPEGVGEAEKNHGIGMEELPFCAWRELGSVFEGLGEFELLLCAGLCEGEETRSLGHQSCLRRLRE